MPNPRPGQWTARIAVALLSVTLISPSTRAEEITDYAYQAVIDSNDQTLQRIDLGSNILTSLARPDLADIVVINAAGQRLPQRLVSRPETTEKHQLDLEFHVFRQFVERGAKQVTRRERQQHDAGMSELTTTETVPVLATDNHYLVDLGGEAGTRRFERLELEWAQQPEDRLVELRIEVGNDLGGMRALDTPVVLGKSPGGQTDWRSISEIEGRYRYLSLAPQSDISHFELQRVIGHYQTRIPAPLPSLEVSLGVTNIDGNRFYTVDLPWAVRPRTLRILPGEANRMLEADMYLSTGDQPRRLVQNRIMQHSFDNGGASPGPTVKLPRGEYDRIWFSFTDTPEVLPKVEFQFEPKQLVFLADGRQPYRLAWGNYDALIRTDNLHGVLGENSAQAYRQATLVGIGAAVEAGGQARLNPDTPLPWNKWLLWALLVAAALVTARMAFTLFREMNAASTPPAD